MLLLRMKLIHTVVINSAGTVQIQCSLLWRIR
ncbi:Uncharacterised protein [Vibrio cholerae]|nr:Uncharacterised protein [Vibrio cholerae]